MNWQVHDFVRTFHRGVICSKNWSKSTYSKLPNFHQSSRPFKSTATNRKILKIGFGSRTHHVLSFDISMMTVACLKLKNDLIKERRKFAWDGSWVESSNPILVNFFFFLFSSFLSTAPPEIVAQLESKCHKTSFKLLATLLLLKSLSEAHTASSDSRSHHNVSSAEQVFSGYWVQGTSIK